VNSFPHDTTSLEDTIGYVFRRKGILLKALTHKSFHNENADLSTGHNERLEFLGDSVLSLYVVDYLYGLKDSYPESEMSRVKSYVVQGTVLSEVALEISLGSYIRLGKGEEDTGGREKASVLANALEALIGAVYVDGGPEPAGGLVKRLFSKKIMSALRTSNYHDYKTELQERCQMIFGVLPEYRLAAQEGLEHEKTFAVEVYVSEKRYGAGIGRSKKEAQTAAAKEALKRLA
jgi:ribonuclease-3